MNVRNVLDKSSQEACWASAPRYDHFDRRDKSNAVNRLGRRLNDLGYEVDVKLAA